MTKNEANGGLMLLSRKPPSRRRKKKTWNGMLSNATDGVAQRRDFFGDVSALLRETAPHPRLRPAVAASPHLLTLTSEKNISKYRAPLRSNLGGLLPSRCAYLPAAHQRAASAAFQRYGGAKLAASLKQHIAFRRAWRGVALRRRGGTAATAPGIMAAWHAHGAANGRRASGRVWAVAAAA